MIQRLWTAIWDGTDSASRTESAVDACIECGSASLPAARRCIECVED
jgi:hypothetical protein